MTCLAGVVQNGQQSICDLFNDLENEIAKGAGIELVTGKFTMVVTGWTCPPLHQFQARKETMRLIQRISQLFQKLAVSYEKFSRLLMSASSISDGVA